MSTETPQLPVFVYGTLRGGCSNAALLEGKVVRRRTASLSGAVLVHNGSYPYLLERNVLADAVLSPLPDDVASAVQGELVEVPVELWEQTLLALDALEGCDSTAPIAEENLYNRVQRQAVTPSGKSITCWAYIPPAGNQVELLAKYPLISTGNWHER